MIYGIDFDGTLCEFQRRGIGEEKTKVVELVKLLKQHGHKLILVTVREGQALRDAVEWCADRGLFFDAINDNLPEVIEELGYNSRKILWDLLVDDKVMHVNDFEREYDNG